MKSAVTVSLVPEASGGPFVFWDGLEAAFKQANLLGFDGVEIFAPEPSAIPVGEVSALMSRYRVAVAAVGTGAGWVKHRLHLCHPDAEIRSRARKFIEEMTVRAGALCAPAILGSMQGRVEPGVEREQALDWLAEGLESAQRVAASTGNAFLYEPLNRYETNLFNRQLDAASFLKERGLMGVRILADLFHMNIEEADIPATLCQLGDLLGHVHFADSNRWAVGFGHLNIIEVMEALKKISYDGFLSAEVLPLPDSAAAAQRTIVCYLTLMGLKPVSHA